MERIQVNDGGGLMNHEGMIDSLITDCNENFRKLLTGNYIAFGNGMAEMVRKLALLKDGVKKDIENRDEQIRELTAQLNGGDTNDP